MSLFMAETSVVNDDFVFVGFEKIYAHIMKARIAELSIVNNQELCIEWANFPVSWNIRSHPKQELEKGDILWEIQNNDKTSLMTAFLNQGLFLSERKLLREL